METGLFHSFELQAFQLELAEPVRCGVVYRPPKFNKVFIQEFSEFIGGISLKFDKFLILIVRDFNIPVRLGLKTNLQKNRT